MSSTDTPSTTTSDSSPKFPSKEWFLKNKVLVGIVVIVVLLGTGVGIYFAVRPKSGTAGGGSTDTGARKNGKWSNWSAECVKQGDQWVKTRTCLEEGKNGGLLCSQIDGGKTTQICEAIPGGWRTPADSDAVCKLEDGKWMKERFCDDPAPKYGGATCNGSNKVECTPQNGYWTPSFNETTCKVETDAQGKPIVDSTGRTNYYKTITCIDPQYGGSPCPARTETGVVVSGGKARIKCGHTDGVWTQFSTCALDNLDNSVKTRTCTLPTLGGLPCIDYYPLMNLVNDDDSGYVVSASSVHPGHPEIEAWKASRAFDGNIQTCWHSNEQSSSNLYDSLDGTYKGATLTSAGNGTTYRGEWIQIQFPPSTIHTRFQAVGIKITPRQDAWSGRSPRNFVLLGSNPSTLTNITSWTVIYDNTLLDGIKDWTASAKTIYFPTSASSGYTIYRLVITRVGNDCPQGKEVFHVRPTDAYATPKADAAAVCSRYNSTVATQAQLLDAWQRGADWCSTGWLSDTEDARYPINTSLNEGCGNGVAGIPSFTPNSRAHVNCYGIKPEIPRGTDKGIDKFNSTFYRQPCGRTSVQIAELKIIGTPFVTADSTGKLPLDVAEKIPCNQDCRYGEWGDTSYNTTDKKWIQTRPKTDPIGNGSSCDSSQLTRDCPDTNKLSWTNKWGAFRTINIDVNSKTGVESDFIPNVFYKESDKYYQVQYLKPTSRQCCPDNTAPENGMCYKTRSFNPLKFGKYELVSTYKGYMPYHIWANTSTDVNNTTDYCCIGANTNQMGENGKVTCSKTWCKDGSFPEKWTEKDGKLQLNGTDWFLGTNTSNEAILTSNGSAMYWKSDKAPYHISYGPTPGSRCLQASSDGSVKWAPCDSSSNINGKQQSWGSW